MKYTESNVIKLIKQHEGSKYNDKGQMISYFDTEGNLTAGYGHKVLESDVDINGNKLLTEGQVISTKQADDWFTRDSRKAIQQASSIVGFDRMSPARQKAMIDLTYNMGIGWTNEFPKAYGYIKNASNLSEQWRRDIQFKQAAEELRYRDADDKTKGRSKYFNQTKSRAVTITGMVENG